MRVPTSVNPNSSPIRKAPVYVAVGDSLTAGMQDATLNYELQKRSFSTLLADTADLTFQVPEIHRGSIPPKLFDPGRIPIWRTLWSYTQLALAGAVPVAAAILGFQPPSFTLLPLYHVAGMGRQEGPDETHNLAVPGFELRHLSEVKNVSDFNAAAVRREENPLFIPLQAPLIRAVLQKGQGEQNGRSQLDLAIEKKPDLITLWAGNNDILYTALQGNTTDQTLTPIEDRRWLLNPGEAEPRFSERVVPGLMSSMVGPQGALTRLLNETEAEVMLLNIPDVTTIPHLLTVGEKVGPLPFEVVLPDGTDITKRLEEFRIPAGIRGAKDGERSEFPAGTRVGLGTLLGNMHRHLLSQDTRAELSAFHETRLFTEGDVLDPDEIAQIQDHTDRFNQILSTAAENPRVHLVDINQALTQAKTEGYRLRGQGPEITVGTGYTGSVDSQGHPGLFSHDGVHPGDVGQAVVANLILDVAKARLADDPRFESLVRADFVDEKKALENDPKNSAGRRPRLVLADLIPTTLSGFGLN